MTPERLSVLISRKLASEATPEEMNELDAHFAEHPEDQYMMELLSAYWNAVPSHTSAGSEDAEEHFNSILNRAEEASETASIIQMAHQPRRSYFKWVAVAAMISGLIFMAFLFRARHDPKTVKEDSPTNEIVANKGVRSKLMLPDGSQVWLNGESKISYSKNFDDSLREVTLEGEAFFDVVKNPKRPFIVHTSGINIRVLGTAFNVKSYPQEATIEATLIRGLIEVQRENEPAGSKVILRPHEKLVFNKPLDKITSVESREGQGSVATLPVRVPAQQISISTLPKNLSDSTIRETSWVYGRLLFDGDTFQELAGKMERWFNVKIEFRNKTVAGIRFGGGGFENENIEEALQALQLTASFRYTIRGNVVQIDKK